MKTRLLAVVGAAWISGGVLAYAHHSFSATYDVATRETIKGEIVQLQFRSPHSFVQVMAPDSNGKMQRWAIEWTGGQQLVRQGVTPETLKVGDVVVVSGPRARNGDFRLLLRRIERPLDGWSWSGEFNSSAVDIIETPRAKKEEPPAAPNGSVQPARVSDVG